MFKKLIISISCLWLFCSINISNALADIKCQNEADAYCINVDVKNSQKPNNFNNDLCYVLQINASDQFINGSVHMSQLPAAIFEISKNQAISGKPLIFKMIKAAIVPSGQCGLNPLELAHVDGCEIVEYAAIAGVSRSIFLTKSRKTTNFTCDITN